MYSQTRGGTRGGAAEFKWSDVSADKDREHYLGHSINAPTGRWQKNKDVHWYNRDLEQSEFERQEEIRKIKEAEEDALAVALGFKPVDRSVQASTSDKPEDAEEKAKEKEAKRLRKEEKRKRKEERRERRERRKHSRSRSRSRSVERGRYDEEERPHRRADSRSRSPPRYHDIYYRDRDPRSRSRSRSPRRIRDRSRDDERGNRRYDKDRHSEYRRR